MARFDALIARAASSATPLTIAVVGGGAGGVEIALALAYRLRCMRRGGGVAEGVAAGTDAACGGGDGAAVCQDTVM